MEAPERGGGTQATERDRGGRTAAIVTLAVGALAVALGLAAALSRAGEHPAGTNGVIAELTDPLHGPHRICQAGERIPAGTSALRVSLVPAAGARPGLTIAVLREPTLAPLATGSAVTWARGSATVSLRTTIAHEAAVRVCLRLRPHDARAVDLLGAAARGAASATDGGAPLGGRFRVEYLSGSAQSWWSFAPAVVERLGRGHAVSGSAVALLAGLLMLISIGVASWLLVRTS